ncbi:hypothetical protein COL5a_003013 [Colletotrichum fioriniae]|uniref:uncharacterized protein n=1 Tax=Colletotrichum fioriniae TaxID=710243 RepID=UPI0023014774|nr:uncharacterized protein COL516b_011428 [Colletotrichum fioriniae]KAJ0296572.1 hypothetical protein COL516b_011428 [Colletotrichum fioriniae]KAJ0330712.1 hypothetical protein COL5a_003013 [Colletotrichum fioriniae]KAJ3945317.1 hypothetical protein N0V96_005346 [Colletotrichum fioriniae]
MEERLANQRSDIYNQPDAHDPELVQRPTEEAKRPQRHASVYDAVAGRIIFDTALNAAVRDEKTPHANSKPPKLTRHSINASALAPEEVLFRRKSAPERFAEFDVYMAHDRNLADSGRTSLPDSDLLKSVHTYASYFYSALGGPKRNLSYQVGARNIDERSMDESALIALGILLEEAGRDVLGSKGDMVFTEGLHLPEDSNPTYLEPCAATDTPTYPVLRHVSRETAPVSFADVGSWKRATKRQKLSDPDNA